MNQSQIFKQVEACVGGSQNIIQFMWNGDELVISLKDKSLVDIRKLNSLEDVRLIKTNRNYLYFSVNEKINNVKEREKMAKKEKPNYDVIAQIIVDNIGGSENIKSLRHCYTRLRFVLKDRSKVNTETLKATEGIISIVENSNEYMIVIGNDVSIAYDAVCRLTGYTPEKAIDENLDEDLNTEGKKNPFSKVLSIIMASMHPILNMICACGITKGILAILVMLNIVSAGSGIHTLMSGMGDAIFFFLPIALGYNLAKNLDGDPFLGFLIGAILCYPSLNGVDLTLFGHTFNATYTGSFLPVAFIVAIAIPMYKWINRFMPKLIKGFMTPVIVLLITIPIGFMLIGPVANLIGTGINDLITTLFRVSPVLAGIVAGGTWQILVVFGVHGVPSTFMFANLAAGNSDQYLAIALLHCFAQTGMVLAIYLKTKSPKLKAVALPALTSGIFGITEPALYGVTLPRMKMFVLSCIACAIGSVAIVLMGVTGYAFTGTGFIALLGLLNPEAPNIILPVIGLIIYFVSGLLLGLIFYKDTGADAEDAAKALVA